MWRYILGISVGFLFFSCSGKTGNAPLSEGENKGYHTDMEKTSSKNEGPTQKPPQQPLPIKSTSLRYKNLKLKEPFSEDSALLKLYPGNREEGIIDGKTLSLWACPDCDILTFEGWLVDEPLFFPNTEGMETEVIKSCFFEENGKQYVSVFFDSHEVRHGEPGTGRFVCSFLGAALFEKENGYWRLTAFEPVVDCTGNYGTARCPDTVNVGGNYKFLLKDANGGAGQPYIGHYVFYDFSGNRFKKELEIEDGSLQSWKHSWETSFSFLPGDGHKEYLIMSQTSGTFDEQTAEELEEYHLSEIITDVISQKNYNKFSIYRTYEYKKGAYVLKKEERKLSKEN